MSNSVRPQRWQPTRLPRPWGSPDRQEHWSGLPFHLEEILPKDPYFIMCKKQEKTDKTNFFVIKNCNGFSIYIYMNFHF